MFDVCTTGDTAHIDMIFKFLPHTRVNMLTRVCHDSPPPQNAVVLVRYDNTQHVSLRRMLATHYATVLLPLPTHGNCTNISIYLVFFKIISRKPVSARKSVKVVNSANSTSRTSFVMSVYKYKEYFLIAGLLSLPPH